MDFERTGPHTYLVLDADPQRGLFADERPAIERESG
jgi:hypothetical protein